MTFNSKIETATALRLYDGSHYNVMTCVLEMPRYLLAQFNTYGCMVRSVASSRAIPHHTFREMAEKTYVYDKVPLNKHQRGMATDEELSVKDSEHAKLLIKTAFLNALDLHIGLDRLNVSKGQANRLLEPFMTVSVVATASMEQWNHIFDQRLERNAQKEWEMVLRPIVDELKTRKFVESTSHIPFKKGDTLNEQLLHSVKACASASYANQEKEYTLEECVKTVKRCIKEKHASTYEHQWFVTENGKQWSRTKHPQVQPLRNCDNILYNLVEFCNGYDTADKGSE